MKKKYYYVYLIFYQLYISDNTTACICLRFSAFGSQPQSMFFHMHGRPSSTPTASIHNSPCAQFVSWFSHITRDVQKLHTEQKKAFLTIRRPQGYLLCHFYKVQPEWLRRYGNGATGWTVQESISGSGQTLHPKSVLTSCDAQPAFHSRGMGGGLRCGLAYHSPLSITDIENGWSSTSTRRYAYMACTDLCC